MHSLHGQNVFLPSCGLKSKIVQDYSINRYCEDVRLDGYPQGFFSTFQLQGFWIAAQDLESKELLPGQKTGQVHPREGCQKVI